MTQLAGKTVVVTGAGRGIGAAAAEALAAMGANLVLAARSVQPLMDLAARLHGSLAVPTDVADAVRSQNNQVVAGQLGGPPVPEDQSFQLTINALGRLSDISEFEDIIVKAVTPKSSQNGQKSQNGSDAATAQIVRVKDVARVELAQKSYTNFAAVSGHKAAQILVYGLPDANALDVGAKVKDLTKKMAAEFPEGLSYRILYDTTDFIEQSIHAVYETLYEAGFLVLAVVILFLQNWRATLVPATTVPVTIIGAFAAMWSAPPRLGCASHKVTL